MPYWKNSKGSSILAEWKTVGELFDFEKGSLQSSKCIPGEYPFITAAEEWKTHESYTHDCEALVFAMGASGSLGRTHYVNGKFISSDLCFILTPKKDLRLDLVFYHRLFNLLRQGIVQKTATGTSKLSINSSHFRGFRLPYFDYEYQVDSRAKIEVIAKIIDELSSQLDQQSVLLSRLRQQILQEAIEGKLTAEWRREHHELVSGDNHASKLLERIRAEKEQLIKGGKLRKEQSSTRSNDADKPFELPKGWVWCRLGDIANGFDYGSSSKSKKAGKVPVLRMGNLQNGIIVWDNLVYTDNDDEVKKYMVAPGDILFNRTNSRELVGKSALYNDDRDAIFAGYLVRFHMCGGLSSLFASFVMNSHFHRRWCNKVKSDALGQSNINATKLRDYSFPLPPIAEQTIIVGKTCDILLLLNGLERQALRRKSLSEVLMQSVLREAFANESGC